jgi:SAM-dependent methyltransferase
MSGYAIAYRLGVTPWERYATAAAPSTAALLDREEAGRPRPPGRALDLGCGRGLHTAELARRGWEAVGVDAVPRAVEAATAGVPAARFAVGDVTALSPEELGTFDLFLDIGCFQGLRPGQRAAEGRSVTALARPGATLLLMAFGPTRVRSVIGGVSPAEVAGAFPGWELLSDEPADTAGLGRAMARTAPRWYRLRRPVR